MADQRKKYQDWKDSISGFLGKDFWSDFQDFFTKNWPQVNLYQNETQVLCLIALPGIQSVNDVHIFINHTQLTIKGHLNWQFQGFEPVEEEIYKGRFERVIKLPVPVHHEPVEAVYKKGILLLTLNRIRDFEVSEIIIADDDN
ncbi:Hsp20/alpha crystallin family protein [Tuberibacillus calidus]|jgi:HSP20 family protein|uniref:Hsp20/alpha crystallin family protein n=1 Tax=Tuberibacillus calidus TaxID=340097 RepID=UPI0003FBFBD6|nr:Hsp20/alpha crystallin family protein [Tuberibacillus calidus]